MTLTSNLLIKAYASGFFPMPYGPNDEIHWFNPDPRAILPLDNFHASRSLKRSIKKNNFSYTINKCFEEVMNHCGNRKDTWINDEIKKAYLQLHLDGGAHSLEVWCDGKIAGGLYGVSVGSAFFAESKFHTITDGSKAALYFLVEHMNNLHMELLEIQFMTDHLKSLGAIHIDGLDYEKRLEKAVLSTNIFHP